MYILFPSDYFDPKSVDGDLLEEYRAASGTGLYKILLFGYEDWFINGRLRLSETPEKESAAVYRGWMMKPEQYAEFYNRLLENNIRLITAPAEYERFHIFPKIYPMIERDTAGIMVFPDGSGIELGEIKQRFPRFMVKDFVKSVKGTDFPKYFDSAVTEEQFSEWMKVFYKYRGGLYTGGICVKEYLDLKTCGGKTNEYRAFIANGSVVSLCRNSLQPDYTSKPDRELLNRYLNLDSPFYTLDLAELADGSWKIIEAGDGQVSGLSPGQDCGSFFRALYRAFG